MTVPVPTPLVARTPPLGEPSARHEINLTVNGRPVTAHVESRLLLSDFLRDRPAPEVRSPGHGVARERGVGRLSASWVSSDRTEFLRGGRPAHPSCYTFRLTAC